MEQSLSETVEVATARKERKETESSERDEALAAAASRTAAAEAELAELKAELALATENHEWLRRALEARTAANATAETERQALSARVVELERILDESEAHLAALQTEREAHKMKYKKRAAAANAQRLAAEATAAMLKGEMARMRAQMDKKEKEASSVPEQIGVLEDVANRAALGTSERVAGGEDASTEALRRAGSPGARVSASSAMASPSCAKDDSAMGRVGPAEDGSETVSKPARKRDVALSSPAAAMEFERAPETTKALAANVAGLATKTSWAISPTKGFFAGTELSSHVCSVAMLSVRLFARVASGVMRDAADARRGVRVTPRTASANFFLACLVAACVFVAMLLSSALAFESLGLGLTYGVRMGGVLPQKGFGSGYVFGFFSFLNELRNGLRRLGGVAAV